MGARPKCPREFDRRFWAGIREGLASEDAARAAGMSATWGRRTFSKAGGVNPTRVIGPVGRYLSWPEREESAALEHAGHGWVRSPGGWTVTRPRSAASSAVVGLDVDIGLR